MIGEHIKDLNIGFCIHLVPENLRDRYSGLLTTSVTAATVLDGDCDLLRKKREGFT
jgi:hypothetical protein